MSLQPTFTRWLKGTAAALLMAAVALPTGAQAQDVLDNPVWSIPADSKNWFANDNNTRGFAFNEATGNLIVFSRTGGLKPVILDAATGDSLGVLDVTGIGGGTFPASLIDVSPDGRIFAANLTLNAVDSPYRIYSWANESAAPKLIYAGNVNETGFRFGDSFMADFTDGNTYLLGGGSGNPNLGVFTYDAALDTISAVRVLAFDPLELRAVRGMSSIAGQDSIWVNEFEFNLRKVSLTTGETGTIVPEGVFPTKEALWVDYANANGRELAGVFPSNLTASGQSASIIDLATGEEIAYTVAGANSNANGTGGPIFDIPNGMMYLMASNNAISAYDISAYIPVEETIQAFNLLSPADGTELSLSLPAETEITVEWEAAASTAAWSRENASFVFDSFAHGGDGANGTGGYVGSNLGEPSVITLPLLDSPASISMWAATYSNATVLSVDVDKSSDGQTWETVATLEALSGGSGDINLDWKQVSADLNATGETYVRIVVYGDNIQGAAYFDDVRVEDASGNALLDEGFNEWESFQEVTYTWHLDAVTGSFDPPALSIPVGGTNSVTLTVGAILAEVEELEIPAGLFNGAWTVTAEFGEEVRFAEQVWTIDLDVPQSTSLELGENPFEFALEQNFPNPFNPTTSISYSIAESGMVELAVYTVTGQRVATLVSQTMPAGRHTVNFDASSLSSGVYIYRITNGDMMASQKMMLVK